MRRDRGPVFPPMKHREMTVPAGLRNVPSELEAARILSAAGCYCETPKRRLQAFCWPCYSSLPHSLQLGLQRPLRGGFCARYAEAKEWLEERRARKIVQSTAAASVEGGRGDALQRASARLTTLGFGGRG